MAAATDTLRTAADRLDDAYRCYAHDNSDGFGDYAWRNAYEYREDGYALAEEAFLVPDVDNDREAFIEAAIEEQPASARYLIACAVAFRLAELAERPNMARAA